MRPEDLQVNLRPRSPWEAMELGAVLLRRHAAAVWRPWLACVLVVALACHALAWLLGMPWLGLLLLWWSKPALEQVPLFVLSRAVFGQVPDAATTLRALPGFGWRWLPAYLVWRRLGPSRSLLMPVDLLEGNARAHRGIRRRVIGGPAHVHAALLTGMCAGFEWVLVGAAIAAIFLFVPAEDAPAWARMVWEARGEAQGWLWAVLAVAALLALAVIGPFYVAAGFGLYLNRRAESEAWDVELAFRRLRERLLARALPLLVGAALGLGALLPPAAWAFDAPAQDSQAATPVAGDEEEDKDSNGSRDQDDLGQVFGSDQVDPSGFARAMRQAYQDPLLGGERAQVTWVPKWGMDGRGRDRKFPDWTASLARWGEFALWTLAGVLVLALLLTLRRWLPWLRGGGRRRQAPAQAQVQVDELALPEVLPDNIPAAARRLWTQGRQRAALALLYRASVQSLEDRIGQPLPAGATEAYCLRVSRQLPATLAGTFAGMVRVWQYAAYAGRLPDPAAFEALVEDCARQWGWAG
jgi:hypothetical protein